MQINTKQTDFLLRLQIIASLLHLSCLAGKCKTLSDTISVGTNNIILSECLFVWTFFVTDYIDADMKAFLLGT